MEKYKQYISIIPIVLGIVGAIIVANYFYKSDAPIIKDEAVLDENLKPDNKAYELKRNLEKNIDSYKSKDFNEKFIELISMQKNNLSKEIDYYYSEKGTYLQKNIVETQEVLKHDAMNRYYGNLKYEFLKNIKDKETYDILKTTFDNGYALINLEGTYYPVIDYSYYNAKYESKFDDVIKKYVSIMAIELEKPAVSEELLRVDLEELKNRLYSYDDFMKNNLNFKYSDDIKILYKTAIWKVMYPDTFDKLLDENQVAKQELINFYETIDMKYELTYEICKEIYAFIKLNNNSLQTKESMDGLSELSYKLFNE